MSTPSKDNEPIVLGQLRANARKIEELRKARTDLEKSPLPALRYDAWRGEQDLRILSQLPLDSQLTEIINDYLTQDQAKRQRIRDSISMDEFYTLLTFARRAAVFAIREKNRDWLIKGMTAIAMIEQDRVDYRDIVLAMLLLSHAAN